MDQSDTGDRVSSLALREALLELARRKDAYGAGQAGAARLMEEMLLEDPVGIKDRSCAVLATTGFLLDVDALITRAIAFVCFRCSCYRRSIQPDEWLDDCAAEAARSIVGDEVSMAEQVPPAVAPGFREQSRFWFLTRTLGIEPKRAWHYCMVLNTMYHPWRRAFVAIARDRRTFDAFASENGISAEGARTDFEAAAKERELDPLRVHALIEQEGMVRRISY